MGLIMFRRSRFRQRFSTSTSAVALATVTCLVGGAALAQRIMADDAPVYARNLAAEPSDGSLRIVGGIVAQAGAYPSMVTLHRRDSQSNMSFCGGTIIDTHWVLTAGHCVTKLLNNPQILYIREGGNVVGQGRAINVTSITLHESYDPRPPLNDVALLRLAEPARAPRQVLLPSAMRPDYLRDKKMSTVIGYGLVQPQAIGATAQTGNASDRLLQVDLPLVSQPACAQLHGAAAITEATVCAGYDEGKKDSCQGDSGGPLFVRSPNLEPVQVGVVSWGPGCAQPKAIGVYASVGYFEGWIRQRVPNASFAKGTSQNLQGGGGANQQIQNYVGVGGGTAQPSQLAQVTLDIAQGSQIKVGDRLDVSVTSSVDGHLFLFNQEMGGKAYQIFPNKLSGGNLPGQAKAHINRGQRVTVPGPLDRFVLRIKPPAAKNRVIALVVPSDVKVDDLAQKNEGMQTIDDFDAFLASIVGREQSTRGVSVEEATPTKRAVAIREYDIVP
jgi:secreted trypsin-like serine protease